MDIFAQRVETWLSELRATEDDGTLCERDRERTAIDTHALFRMLAERERERNARECG